MISYFLDVFSYLFKLSHSIIIPVFFHALLQLKFHSVFFYVNLCHGKWEKNLTKWILPSADQFWATTQHTHETLFKNKYSRFKNKYSQFKNKYSHHIDTATRTNVRWGPRPPCAVLREFASARTFLLEFTLPKSRERKSKVWGECKWCSWIGWAHCKDWCKYRFFPSAVLPLHGEKKTHKPGQTWA